jgi:hypothetical protein
VVHANFPFSSCVCVCVCVCADDFRPSSALHYESHFYARAPYTAVAWAPYSGHKGISLFCAGKGLLDSYYLAGQTDSLGKSSWAKTGRITYEGVSSVLFCSVLILLPSQHSYACAASSGCRATEVFGCNLTPFFCAELRQVLVMMPTTNKVMVWVCPFRGVREDKAHWRYQV